MLEQFRRNLRKEDGLVFSRVTLVEQDVTRLDLPDKAFKLALIPFNSLLLITDFDLQRAALRAAAAHLAPGGTLVVDVVNPLTLKLQGDPVAKPYYTRRSPHGGNLYTMFAMLDPVDANHKQRMHGWYDEVEPDGVVKRRHFELHWRPIFRFELELMLREAGFRVASLEGGQRHEPYTAQSPRLFVRAVRE